MTIKNNVLLIISFVLAFMMALSISYEARAEGDIVKCCGSSIQG